MNLSEILSQKFSVNELMNFIFSVKTNPEETDIKDDLTKSIAELCEKNHDGLNIFNELFEFNDSPYVFLSVFMSLYAYGEEKGYFDKEISMQEMIQFMIDLENEQ